MRLFVGIPLPEDVRQGLRGVCSGLPGARWVPPENLHVTLRFIGEAEAGEAEDVDAALAGIRAPNFDLRVVGIGFFDRGRRVHAVWAGVEAGPALAHLHGKVESAVVRAGFEPERRKFKPHITLARLKGTPVHRVGEFMQTRESFQSAPFAADGFVLYRSHLGNGGAHHEALADYPLDAA